MISALSGSGEASSSTRARRSRLLPLSFTSRNRPPGNGMFVPQPGTVGALTRLIRPLAPQDKIAVAHDLLRKSPAAALCVAVNGRIAGVLTVGDLNRALSHPAWPGASSLAAEPLSVLMTGPEPVLMLPEALQLDASATLDDARKLFEEQPDAPLIGIVINGNYLGVLVRSDLVAADLNVFAPARVGGMATPLGVYLTDGVVQGGAGNLGLFLTGICMSLFYTVAICITTYGLSSLERYLHFSITRELAMTFLRLNPSLIVSMSDDLRAVLAIPVLLILLRLVPISGYHAAEHQVVHCIERGEPLIAETVKLMPRAHPRCGTNLVAGVGIFSAAMTVLFGMTSSIAQSVVPALLVTLALWRPVGTFLQNSLTTRPASTRQIESGIRAGRQVMQRHLYGGIERRPSFGQRIWNMGFVQLILGSYLVVGILELLVLFVPSVGRYVSGLGF